MENNKQQKNTALIRIILCVAVMIILFLDIFKIVSRKDYFARFICASYCRSNLERN